MSGGLFCNEERWSFILNAMQKRRCPNLTFRLRLCWNCPRFWCAVLSGNRILSSQPQLIWALVSQVISLSHSLPLTPFILTMIKPLQIRVPAALSTTTGPYASITKHNVLINSFHRELRGLKKDVEEYNTKRNLDIGSVHSARMWHVYLPCPVVWLTCWAQHILKSYFWAQSSTKSNEI